MLPLSMVLISTRDRNGWLIVADAYAKRAEKETWLSDTTSFATFGHFEEVNPKESYIESVRRVLTEAGLEGTTAKLGIESPTLPTALGELLYSEFSKLKLIDAAPSLQQARWIKTEREVSLLRDAAKVADCGQRTLVKLSKSFDDFTEFDLWSEIEKQMTMTAGGLMTITGELVTGPRITTINFPGGPIPRQINVGDSGLMDISPRVKGYWADCTNTVVFGTDPSPVQRRYFIAAREGFEAAVEMLRPGVRCCDVEAAVRRTFKHHGFPVTHYSGHQIGVSVNESPRLVPYDTSIIEPGMVFAIEPGVYGGPDGSNGARAERMVLVTESGSEVLSQFPWGIN